MERVKRTNLAKIMSEQHPLWRAFDWAGFFGVDQKVIRMYKRGDWDFTVPHLQLFAERLNVEPRALLGWDEDELWADPFAKLLNPEERRALQERETASLHVHGPSGDRP